LISVDVGPVSAYGACVVDRSGAARMRLRMRVHYVSGNTRLQRVVMTAAPLRHTRADLLRLGALFRLAAVSPHSAVFVPLRANRVGEWVAPWADSQGLADLAIVRRNVHLRPSNWPSIRARLGRTWGALLGGEGCRPC
jgi:hypothetical protein